MSGYNTNNNEKELLFDEKEDNVIEKNAKNESINDEDKSNKIIEINHVI